MAPARPANTGTHPAVPMAICRKVRSIEGVTWSICAGRWVYSITHTSVCPASPMAAIQMEMRSRIILGLGDIGVMQQIPTRVEGRRHANEMFLKRAQMTPWIAQKPRPGATSARFSRISARIPASLGKYCIAHFMTRSYNLGPCLAHGYDEANSRHLEICDAASPLRDVLARSLALALRHRVARAQN